MAIRIGFISVILSLLLAGVAHAASTISWEELVPPQGLGAEIKLDKSSAPVGMPDISEFDGSKEEFETFRQDISIMKEMQPQGGLINVQLHGRKVKIAGYVTPVGFDGEDVTEFLFVPYLGACIHVPPPPANQIIYVKDAKGLTAEQVYEPVWLTGTLQAKSVSTVLADVGYVIQGATVEPYTE